MTSGFSFSVLYGFDSFPLFLRYRIQYTITSGHPLRQSANAAPILPRGGIPYAYEIGIKSTL